MKTEPRDPLLSACEKGVAARLADQVFGRARVNKSELERSVIDIAVSDAISRSMRSGAEIDRALLETCIRGARSHVETSPHFAALREDG